MEDNVDNGKSKTQHIREHIEEISIFAAILYDYINAEKGSVKRLTLELENTKDKIKKDIVEMRKLKSKLKRNVLVVAEVRTILKKKYKVDLNALEVAEEL